MATIKLPKRKPDFQNLIDVLERKVPKRRTQFEFIIDDEIMEKLAGCKFCDCKTIDEQIRLRIDAFVNGGYDYITTHGSSFRVVDDVGTSVHTKNKNVAIITDRKSYEEYKWREPFDYSYEVLDKFYTQMPKEMKLIIFSADGIFENVTSLVGYENICLMLYDEPELLSDIFKKVCDQLYKYYSLAINHPTVGAILCNDDWGFRSQTLLPPDAYRQHIFPTYKKIVTLAHKANKKAILHSCGQLDSIMDDIIDDIKFDGKHSSEDTILPIEEQYKKYGNRIAILGGIDVDFLTNRTPAEITGRCENMYKATQKNGGYAMGSGNSIPAYIPYQNYLAMIKTALQ